MKYKAQVKVLTDWQDIADNAAFTQRLEAKPITESYLRKMIISEHSPLRSVELEITWWNVPYFVHVHLQRHWVGVVPFGSTQRPTAFNPVDYDRRKAPQDAVMNFRLKMNVQSLLDAMKKRLCMKADVDTRNAAIDVLWEMRESDDSFLVCLSHACRPACEWHGRECHEVFGPCGQYPVMPESRFWEVNNE